MTQNHEAASGRPEHVNRMDIHMHDAAAPAISPELARLIEAERKAYDAYGEAIARADQVRMTRRKQLRQQGMATSQIVEDIAPQVQSIAEFAESEAEEILDNLRFACLDFPCATVEDFRRWSAYVATRLGLGELNEDWLCAALRRLGGLPAEAA